ncbi:MAG: hypothetical protein ACPGYL_15260, partial [Rhodospirillaceae bacterium]
MTPFSKNTRTSQASGTDADGGPDTTAAIGPATLAQVSAAERFIVQGVRMVVHGTTLAVLERLARPMMSAGASDLAAEGVVHLVRALDDAEGPQIRLRRPQCAKLEDDERVILRFVSALARQDLEAAQIYGDLLVSPTHLPRLIHAGRSLVATLT